MFITLLPSLTMIYFYVFLFACMYVHCHVSLVSAEARRGCWIPWNWNCRRLWATPWLLDILGTLRTRLLMFKESRQKLWVHTNISLGPAQSSNTFPPSSETFQVSTCPRRGIFRRWPLLRNSPTASGLWSKGEGKRKKLKHKVHLVSFTLTITSWTV